MLKKSILIFSYQSINIYSLFKGSEEQYNSQGNILYGNFCKV